MGVENRDIMELKLYFDREGRHVKEFVQVFGKEKKDPVYKGVGKIMIQASRPDGMPLPPRQEEIEFFFSEGTTLKKAFETYDEVNKKELGEFVKAMNEKQAAKRKEVVPASAMPAILGANGKPAVKG